MTHTRWAIATMFLAGACSDRTSVVSDLGARELQPAREASVDGPRRDAPPVVDGRPDAGPACAPCTDPAVCCTPASLKCHGDPNGAVVCVCDRLWDCSKDPGHCTQSTPSPAGSTGWSCVWSELAYTCTQKSATAPAADADWSCTFDGTTWTCNRAFPPNPCNSAEGAKSWSCVPDQPPGIITCTHKAGPPPPPCGNGQWTCTTSTDNVTSCQAAQPGLPAGGNDWRCHRSGNLWVCAGTSSTKPGAPWSCEAVGGSPSAPLYRCTAPVDPCEKPPGLGSWQCFKGSSFKGTRCERLPDGECVPGQQRWCDGLTYSGWGLVTCQPDGKWKTKDYQGKPILDCVENATGQVPDTLCACYHAYFNPACCERQDCVVPQGASKQTCPASTGVLCSYCKPTAPECKDAGAKCIVSNTHETFCGSDCAASTCPAGYSCMTIKLASGTTKQCVPVDLSCYY